MGHYDNCRPGYCAKCGAAPGNMIDGECPLCKPSRKVFEGVFTKVDMSQKQQRKGGKVTKPMDAYRTTVAKPTTKKQPAKIKAKKKKK